MNSAPRSRITSTIHLVILVSLSSLTAYTSKAIELRDVYIHGGMVSQSVADITLADGACGTPVAYFGCGNSAVLERRETSGDDGGYAFNLGVGFRVNDEVRFEFTFLSRSYFPLEGNGTARSFLPIESSGTAVEITRAFTAVDVTALVANVFYDLPEFRINKLGAFRPFAGIGVGRSAYDMKAHVDRPTASDRNPLNRLTFPNGRSMSAFFGVYAGITREIMENVDLDVSWQHMRFGDAATENGVASVKPMESNAFRPFEVDVGNVEMELEAQGLGLRFRYTFD